MIYSYVGGKPKDIKYVVEESMFKDLRNVLEFMLRDETQKLKYFLEDTEEEDKEFYKKVVGALKLFKDKYEVEDTAINKKLENF